MKEGSFMDLIGKTDEERELISNKLFHLACETIYSLILGIKMVLPLDMDERLRNHLMTIEKNSTESLNKLRELAFNLFPIMIKDLGFVPTLRSFLEKHNENGSCQILLETSGDVSKLTLEQEVLLYRICSESITNFRELHAEQIVLFISTNYSKIIVGIDSKFKEKITEKLLSQKLQLTRKRTESNYGFF